jgi:hypothetical protein
MVDLTDAERGALLNVVDEHGAFYEATKIIFLELGRYIHHDPGTW